MNKFLKGVIAGAAGVLLLVILVLVFRFFGERDRKIYEYMEAQGEIQAMQEDITNRPLDEFLEEPGIRRAVDSAVGEFQRKRDEALQRFVDTLIEDLSEAAEEAIERAAGEVARAAALASLEREVAAIREAARLREENSGLKRGKVKTAVVTGVICFFGGLVVGAGSIAILQGVK
jgi:hypothetical protein